MSLAIPIKEDDVKRHFWLRRLGVLMALLLVMTACASGDTTETTEPTGVTEAPPATQAPTVTEAMETTTTVAEPMEPVKIGALTSLTGTFAPWGAHALPGMQLAVDEINAAGGAAGHMLELVVADDQSNAEEAVAAFERMVEQDGVVAVGGIISSDVGLNTALVAEELQVPLFLVKAGAGSILTQDSRYTFRTCLPAAPMAVGPVAQYAVAQGFTRVGAIIADYGWGRAIEAALIAEFDALPDIELQVEVAPISEQDFSTYLRSLQEFDPQLIVATGHPPGSGPITAQSADLGMKIPVTGSWVPRSLIMGGGLATAAIDRYADFSCADYFSASYQDLAARYIASSGNTFMDDDAVAGYGIVTMVAEAVAAVGTDPVAISEWLHGQTFDLPGYSFEMGWTEWGELAKAEIMFTTTRGTGAPAGTNAGGEWYPEKLILSEPLIPFFP